MTILSDPAAGAAAPAEIRLGVVTGDRLCIRCGFNLTGQTIVREPHYGLVMVRCPECSTPAAVQEYPLLGRWASRWAMLLAGLWLVTLVALWAASAGILFGMANGIAWEAAAPYAETIAREHQAWLKAQIAANDPRATAMQWMIDQQAGPWSTIDSTWWSQLDQEAFFAGAGGWRAAVDWWQLRETLWGVLPIVPMGVLWSVAMLHMRRGRLLLLGLGIAALAAAFAAIEYLSQPTAWGMYNTSGQIAAERVGLPVEAAAQAIFLAMLAASLLLGRRLARLAVRAFLPPRLRGPLAALWLADGLPAPAGRA